jgi:uncharacterized protein YjbI with pentapeptide repeats
MASRQELTNRWTLQTTAVAARALASMDPVAAYQGKALKHPLESPFGEHEGRVDFRGLKLGWSPLHRRLERCDFSGFSDTVEGQLREVALIDCLLDGAEISSSLDKNFERCSFVRARLSRATLNGDFQDCVFIRANLYRCGEGSGLKFIRCDFTGAKFDSAVLPYATFDHCIFSDATFANTGLSYCRFTGTCPNAAQIESAMTDSAKFEGCLPQ